MSERLEANRSLAFDYRTNHSRSVLCPFERMLPACVQSWSPLRQVRTLMQQMGLLCRAQSAPYVDVRLPSRESMVGCSFDKPVTVVQQPPQRPVNGIVFWLFLFIFLLLPVVIFIHVIFNISTRC